jgi:hypothetical protein
MAGPEQLCACQALLIERLAQKLEDDKQVARLY